MQPLQGPHIGNSDEDGQWGSRSGSIPPLQTPSVAQCPAPGLLFTDCLNCTRNWAEPFIHHFIHSSPQHWVSPSHFTDGATGTQRNSGTCPEPHGQRRAEPGLQHRSPRVHICGSLLGTSTFFILSKTDLQGQTFHLQDPSADRAGTQTASCPLLPSRIREAPPGA